MRKGMTKKEKRLNNFEPVLHKLADKLTEILIYFIAIFSPWAFGATEPWSIWTINISACLLGMLLLFKWILRSIYKYTTNNKIYKLDLNSNQTRIKNIHKICNILLNASLLMLIAYIATSATNARASFDLETKEYTYFNEFRNFLPHSYDANASWILFWQFLGLLILYFSVTDWIDSAKCNKHISINPRIKKIIYLLCINGGVIALEAILQRINFEEGKGKLLFLLEPNLNSQNITQYGPFAYRSNAASYLNLIWPISIGFFIHLSNQRVNFNKKRIGNASELILIPCIILMASGPIISSSRGGVIIMLILAILIGLLITMAYKRSIFIILTTIFMFTSCLLIAYIFGGDQLASRLNVLYYFYFIFCFSCISSHTLLFWLQFE